MAASTLTKISDNPKLIKRIDPEVVARSRIPRGGAALSPFTAPTFPPAVEEAVKRANLPTLAMDEQIAGTFGWAARDYIATAYAEGIVFMGYAYLASLSQRPEYRVVTEVIASEMTREWVELRAASGDESKADKIKRINDILDNMGVRKAFQKVTESDGFFGRGHLYLDTGVTRDDEELKMDLGDGRNLLSKQKVGSERTGKSQRLLRVLPVEATWCYPTRYDSVDPLSPDWYRPITWFVMSREVHRSRLLTFIGREMPDVLKPAYAFGGLSMSQMLKPYIDNWLRTRQSVSDLVQRFSTSVLKTNMDATTSVGGDALFNRIALFNNLANNQGAMVLDKDAEDFANVSAPLGGLDSLQAQAQEHMASISRIPLVKLLGIQPAGLNASSEGELVAFEDWIAAFQEVLYRVPLTKVIDFIQLSEFDEVDDDITFDFKPLRQEKPEEKDQRQQVIAATRESYMGMGAVGPDEVREALAQDPESPFDGVDLDKPLPQPPQPPAMPGAPPAPPGGPSGGPPGPPKPPGPPQGGAPPQPPKPPGGGAPDAAPATGGFVDEFVAMLNAASVAQDAKFREEGVKRDEGGRFAERYWSARRKTSSEGETSERATRAGAAGLGAAATGAGTGGGGAATGGGGRAERARGGEEPVHLIPKAEADRKASAMVKAHARGMSDEERREYYRTVRATMPDVHALLADPAQDKGPWKEEEHPRGQPDNSGQFVEGEGSAASETVAEPAEGPEAPEAAEQPEPAKPLSKASLKAAERDAAKKAREAARIEQRERKASAAKGAPEVYVSPNAMNLTFAGAEHELHAKRQKIWHELSGAIDARLEFYRPTTTDAIGSWDDGAENTLIVHYAKTADPALVKVAAAMKASIGNQKAALVFTPSPASDNWMMLFEVKGSLEEIHDRLLNSGLENHTLEPTDGGARVHVYADNQATYDAVIEAAGDADIEAIRGDGEFIGNKLEDGTDEDQRDDARRDYQRIIDQAIAARQGTGPDIGGIWRDTNNHWRAATGADNGVGLYGSQGHPALISTSRPTGATALESDRYRQPSVAMMRQETPQYTKNMGLLKNTNAYLNFRPGELDGMTPDEIAEHAIGQAVDNLVFLYHNTDEEIRKHGPLWYEGAHEMAAAQAKKHGVPVQSMAGVFAALSPQKNWDENVYLAHALIDIVKNKSDKPWDADMTRKGAEIWKAKKDPPTDADIANWEAFQSISKAGKKLSDLTDSFEKAVWVRTYDEAHNTRHFNKLGPDSAVLGPALKKKKKPTDPDVLAKAAWQSNDQIAGAIEALESGGDRAVISRAMGDMHKVRSFYNNILDPNSDNDDVTMDTHAVGAALLQPMSGESQAVMHNLKTNPSKDKLAKAKAEGWQGASGSAVSGLQGTYGLWADAYREAAARIKPPIKPRVLQSVVWEAKRRLMPDDMTDRKRNDMFAAWRDYNAGNATIGDTRQKILDIAHREDKEEPKPKKARKPPVKKAA